MPKMKMEIPHALEPVVARSRIEGMISDVKQQYGDKISDVTEQWDGNTGHFSFRAMGFNVAGVIVVLDHRVDIAADLPWAAKPFQSTIEVTIRERAERLLEP